MDVGVGASGADGSTSFTCKNCGATTSFKAAGRSIHCPFCGSQFVIAKPDDPNTPQPEALIPFNVPDTQVQEIYHTWLGKGFFRPRDLTQLASNHKMRAVYLPVWECGGNAYSNWTAMAGYNHDRQEQYEEDENGQRVTKTRTVTETDWQPASGQHQAQYPRELVSGSRGLPQEWMDKLGAFEFGYLQSYNPQFLVGREAEEAAIDRTSALQIARQQIEGKEEEACRALVPGNTQRDLRVQTQVTDLGGRMIYLPVWLASFQYKGQVYRCVVNGQTGAIGGDAPTSKAKVALVVAAVLAACILSIVLFMVIGPRRGSATPTVKPGVTRVVPTPTVRR